MSDRIVGGWGGTRVLLTVLLGVPGGVAAAEPHEVPPFIEVEVVEALDGDGTLRAWAVQAVADAAVGHVIDRGKVGDRRVVVEVGGAIADYRITVGVKAGRVWVEPPRVSACACNDEAYVGRVRAEADAVMPLLLADRGDAEPVAIASTLPASTSDSPPAVSHGRSGTGMIAGGAAALVIGVGGVAAGGVLLAIDGETRDSGDGRPDRERRESTGAGIALVVVGSVAAVAGVGLILVGAKARRSRATAWHPMIGRGLVGLGWSGRF